MSGPMPVAIADAAGRHALEASSAAAGALLRAEATAKGVSIGAIVAARARATLTGNKGDPMEVLAGLVWREMALETRIRLVTFDAHDAVGDPSAIALQPWGSFSEADRDRLGAAARQMRRQMARAEYLR